MTEQSIRLIVIPPAGDAGDLLETVAVEVEHVQVEVTEN